MKLLDRLARLWQGSARALTEEPRTAAYKPFMHWWGHRTRDLPPFDYYIIEAMLLDPTIRLGLAMRAAPIYGLEFAHKQGEEWVPGCECQNEFVKAYVDRLMARVWQQLDTILTAQTWGWSGGEVTFRLTERKTVEVDKLLPRHSNDVRALISGGEPNAIRIMRVEGKGPVDLAFPKAWFHAYMPESGQIYSEGALKGAYSPWYDKQMNGGAVDVRRLFMHKNAFGGDDLGYPTGTTNIDGKGEVPNRDIAREMVEQLVAGGVTTRPSQRDADGNEKWPLTRAVVPSNPTHILQYPKDLDIEMLRGLEIPDDVLTAEATGAWEGKKVPMMAFYSGLDRWVRCIIDDVVTQIAEPAVMLNFGKPHMFNVTAKPLAEQAMEQAGEQPGGEEQQQQGGQSKGGWSAFTGKRGGTGYRNNATGQVSYGERKMSLEAVARGDMTASEVVETVAEAQRIVRMRSAEGNHWVTIGGRRKDDEDHAGGFPVELDEDGNILKGGPKGLRGKNVRNISKYFRKRRNTPKERKRREGSKIKKQAKAYEMTEDQYRDVAADVWKEKESSHREREDAKKYARERLKKTAGDIRKYEDQGHDYASGKVKGMDTLSREMASMFPSLGWGEGFGDESGESEQELWDLLKEGKVDLPAKDSAEYHDEVAEYLD